MRIIINGIMGHMGAALRACAGDAAIVGGIDIAKGELDIPLFSSAGEVNLDFDVLIDFSVPSAAMSALELCVERQKPIVLCTTGLNDSQIEGIKQASRLIPVFWSNNMSLGVNLQAQICRLLTAALGEDYDIEIVETHHNLKKDAPSGTALMLFNAINESAGGGLYANCGRNGIVGARNSNEVGIHAVRGGAVVGEHEVRFISAEEELIITHKAFSKAVFAKGALRAARFIKSQPAGLYNMNSITQQV